MKLPGLTMAFDRHRPSTAAMMAWLLVVLLALLPIFLLAVYSYRTAATAARDQVLNGNRLAAQIAAQLVQRDLMRSAHMAQVIASFPVLRRVMETGDEEAIRQRLRVTLEAYPGIDRAYVTDTTGRLWSDYPTAPESLGLNFAYREWFVRLAQHWQQPCISEVYRRHAEPKPLVVAIAVPVSSAAGQVLGALVLQYRLDVLSDWVRQVDVGPGGSVIVVDHNGKLAAHTRLDLGGAERDDYATLPQLVAAVEHGRTFSGEYDDPALGLRMVGTFVPVLLGDRRWVVVAQQPLSVAHAPLDLLRERLFLAAGLLGLIAFGAVFILASAGERNRRLGLELGHQNRSLQQLAAIVTSTDDAIVGTDLDGRVVSWNRGAEAMYGYLAGEMLNQTTDCLLPPQATSELEWLLAEIHSGRSVDHYESERRRKDGTLFPVSLTMSPIRDDHGQVVGASIIARDITESRRARNALKEAKEAAELANRTKSQFLANMSHELRTPLNSVIGFTGILLKNKSGNLRAEELNFLERVQANGRHLLALINQILDLSKIEARHVELHVAPVALGPLVQEVVDLQAGGLRDRSVDLRTEIPANLRLISTDGEKLKQVLINLVGNAIKFTEHGVVTVAIRADPTRGQPERLEVVDTGIGIPADRLEQIFEPFRQADSSTSRKYGGTGLGLTISRALCDMLGCRLEVASKPGQGSTFTIVLPAIASLPTGPVSAVPMPICPPGMQAPSPRRRTVLVIDDDPDARMLMIHWIEELGYRVVVAPSGTVGLRLAAECAPDLITLDLLMPGMDGWQVLGELKTNPALRDIPVVVVSIVAEESCGTLFGAVELLQKPVARDLLQHALARHLSPRVLVVDDNQDDRQLLQAMVADLAAEVRGADNGQTALDLLPSFNPEVVILDLMMPVVDGFTFLAKIRSDPRYRHLSVVVVTAKELTVAERIFLTQETRGVLMKAEDLGRNIARLLRECLGPPPAAKTGDRQ